MVTYQIQLKTETSDMLLNNVIILLVWHFID